MASTFVMCAKDKTTKGIWLQQKQYMAARSKHKWKRERKRENTITMTYIKQKCQKLLGLFEVFQLVQYWSSIYLLGFIHKPLKISLSNEQLIGLFYIQWQAKLVSNTSFCDLIFCLPASLTSTYQCNDKLNQQERLGWSFSRDTH